jgi:hypothetical protein
MASRWGPRQQPEAGYDYVHCAVDDYTRLAYSEILADERGPTCAGFIARAAAFFTAHGIAQIDGPLGSLTPRTSTRSVEIRGPTLPRAVAVGPAAVQRLPQSSQVIRRVL